MQKRHHLDEINKPDGIIWFTLVFEDYTNFFVESYNDSNKPFIAERLKNISVRDFDKYEVNGVPLKKLVAAKLEEIQAGERKLSTADRGGG
ncbi:MAG TPA: hypothetical protein VFV23_08600 [Verrucomicrobiae bacterium]|nr:hypothetical protein [Verrucomicrobiae bacterium]